MQFGLTETQQTLKNTVRKFLAAECPLAEVRRIMETETAFDATLWRKMAEQGWTGVFVTHSVEEAVFLSTRIVVLAPNPGRVHSIFAVDLPFPRTAALRETPLFGAFVSRVLHTLRGAIVR